MAASVFDSIVSTYNQAYINSQAGIHRLLPNSERDIWINVTGESGSPDFTVITRDYSVFRSRTPDHVHTALRATLAFLRTHGGDIDLSNRDHKLFLYRVEASFSKEGVEADTIDLEKVIGRLRSPPPAITAEAPVLTSVDGLNYSDEHRLLCKQQILVDDLAIPICREDFRERNDKWKALLDSNPCTSTAHSAHSFILLINAIHSGTFPREPRSILLLSIIATAFDEQEILKECERRWDTHIDSTPEKELLTGCDGVDTGRLRGSVKTTVTSALVSLIWRTDTKDLTRPQLSWALSQNESPLSELQMLEVLEAWEEQQLEAGQAKGSIINTENRSENLLRYIRFENLPRAVYIREVFPRDYIRFEQKREHLHRIQKAAPAKSAVTASVPAARAKRGPHLEVNSRRPTPDEVRVKLRFHVPLKSRRLSDSKKSGTAASESFEALGCRWSMQVDEMKKGGKNHFGIFLYLEESPDGKEQNVSYNFTISSTASVLVCKSKSKFTPGRGKGRYLYDDQNPTLSALISHGCISATLTLNPVKDEEA